MNNEKIILSLGSNIEPKMEFIKKAIQYLRTNGITIEKISSNYASKPVDLENQPEFINIAISGTTFLSPFQLLKIVKSIEKKIGRKKTVEKGPREIDIDIIFYGSVIMSSFSLEIPHKSYKERKFVLNPIAEIVPDLKPPMENRTILQLSEECKDEISNPVII